MKRTGKMILSAALSALTLFSFSGCSGRPVGAPECGGVTDKTDHNAPKTILSKDLTSFYAHFYLRGEWSPGKGDRFYTFDVHKDEQGTLTAFAWTDSVESAMISRPADEKLMATLQSIIDTYKLAGDNGYYRVTAGLPPEFQKCHFNADYASGEKLKFTKNNNPDAEWTKETYLAFARWFAEKGDASLLPPEQSFGPLKRFSLTFTEGGLNFQYMPVRVQEKDAIDGERLLLEKSVYNTEAKASEFTGYILFPEDYPNRIHEILSAHDLRPFDHHSVLYGRGRNPQTKEDKKKEWFRHTLQLHADFEDGKALRINTSDAGDIEMLRPLLSDLFSYYDSLFEE